MESIISYFGTYKPAADGAVASFKFEYLCTLGFAAIVIFLGRAIVARSEALRKYAIPAPVISGLIFSIIVSCIKGAGIVGISFDATIREPMIFPMVPAATPTTVASGAPHSSKIGPNADAVPTPPDIAAEEHWRAKSGCIPMSWLSAYPKRS